MATNGTLKRKIHLGCKTLGLDNDARRDLQLVVTGKASMSDMTEEDLKAMVKRLEADGFTSSKGTGKRFKPASRSDLRLVHKLWSELGKAGQLRDKSRAGLNRFIRARFGDHWAMVPADVDMLTDWSQIDAVIQALKSWGQRADIDFDWGAHLK
ncbi:gp16 family protein [Phaeobacter sp. HF9A]|uniref:gp16 family protein n=1 Tax=Phaeobacter sp. HF9A TaxID=2721561 RepID=UPI001431E9D3|nr:regulatory protein GemA [Phaeobacter sp. HF9A]NIZ13927.1 regulatory protein GemA [Phaeobacter sp. HF9A]